MSMNLQLPSVENPGGIMGSFKMESTIEMPSVDCCHEYGDMRNIWTREEGRDAEITISARIFHGYRKLNAPVAIEQIRMALESIGLVME